MQTNMEDQTNFLLDWAYFCNGKSMEELTESLLVTTMELEAARFKAQQELKQKDDELIQLKHLLNTIIDEKQEAQNQYHMLVQYHHQLNQTAAPPPHSAVSSIEDDLDHLTNGGFCSSDCEESIVSSPPAETPVGFTPAAVISELELVFPVKVLPEKGKLLEAVMKAGPLLQNLLLAGPLPHWRHPPPPLDTWQIPAPPPINKKRGFTDSSIDTRYQRINMKYQRV